MSNVEGFGVRQAFRPGMIAPFDTCLPAGRFGILHSFSIRHSAFDISPAVPPGALRILLLPAYNWSTILSN